VYGPYSYPPLSSLELVEVAVVVLGTWVGVVEMDEIGFEAAVVVNRGSLVEMLSALLLLLGVVVVGEWVDRVDVLPEELLVAIGLAVLMLQPGGRDQVFVGAVTDLVVPFMVMW
jgi:hypothetical protein